MPTKFVFCVKFPHSTIIKEILTDFKKGRSSNSTVFNFVCMLCNYFEIYEPISMIVFYWKACRYLSSGPIEEKYSIFKPAKLGDESDSIEFHPLSDNGF